MANSTPEGALYVEGSDDEHTIKQLLARHEIHIHDEHCPLEVHPMGSDVGVIRAITVAVKSSGKSPVGFVLDTDAFKDDRRLTRTDRWRAIRAKLATVGVTLQNPAPPVDDELPADGFIAQSTEFKRAVGVWLMPDNRAEYGKIEDLLTTLIPANDALFELAKESTSKALELSRNRGTATKAIQSKDERKGQLHSWLAWQEEPGMSYGHALRRKYFEHESGVATAFVSWFKRLFT